MKNILKMLMVAAGAAFLLLGSCYYDSEEYLYGKPGLENCGDTTVLTYSGGVQPILSKNCYSCHSNAAASDMGGGIRLQDYADVKIKTSNGSLYSTITHNPSYSPMPKGGQKLPDCNIRTIKKWIDAGMLND